MRGNRRYQLALGLALGSSLASWPSCWPGRPAPGRSARRPGSGTSTWPARAALPVPADFGYLTAIPLAAPAMLAFPGRAERAVLLAPSLLDGAMITTALLYSSWALVLGPVFRAGHAGVLEQAIALAYPLGDLILVTVVFVVVARIRVGGAPVLLLGAGLLPPGPGRGHLGHPAAARRGQRAGHALRRRSQAGIHLALLFIDLDDFKRVNGQLGHAAGDDLLEAVARRLETCIRGEDTVARLGGDELAILLEQAPSHEVAVRWPGGPWRRCARPSPWVAPRSRSGSPSAAPPRSTTSCARPTWPCTRPRAAARAASSWPPAQSRRP